MTIRRGQNQGSLSANRLQHGKTQQVLPVGKTHAKISLQLGITKDVSSPGVEQPL